MTEKERSFFVALVADRTENAKVLQKRSMRGVKDNAVNKYSDQAHFIYELLQNADDTAATTARFVLYLDRLIFAHNGLRQFSISDPATEDEDSDNGLLGDINSITSYYNSTKTEASIGKFGIGFKAVLQYTDKPEIYDDNFRFYIENQVVPHELASDYPGRKAGETLFVFPFAHADQAYRDIASKLRSLSYPILFLSHLQSISFSIEDGNGLYAKERIKSKEFGQTFAELIHLVHINGETSDEEDMWLFSRCDDAGRRYSVGFPLNKDGALRPVQTDAYCFFKTKEHTGLNFFVHAPFLLNDTREHIVAGNDHNHNMVKLLAALAADSLVYLRNIGLEQGPRLIDDRILDIIPTDASAFGKEDDDLDRLSFLPFYSAIQYKMGSEQILPTADGYVSGKNAYWADTEEITLIISNEQLSQLAGNPDARWVFVTIGRDRGRARFTQYIDRIIGEKWCDENAIIVGRKRRWLSTDTNTLVLPGLNAPFIERQSIEWLHSLYKWLSATDNRTKRIWTVPIFLNRDGHASAAYDEDDEPILFLPSEGITLANTINPQLLENAETAAFIEKVGIRQASRRDYIYNVIRMEYEDEVDGDVDADSHFMLLFGYYCNECPQAQIDEFIELIRGWEFLTCHVGGEIHRDRASNLYFPSSELKAYFAARPETQFVDFEGYLNRVGSENANHLESFLSELGIKRSVSIEVKSLSSHEGVKRLRKHPSCPSNHYCNYFQEPEIAHCKAFVSKLLEESSKENSVLLWNILLQIIQNKCTKWRALSDVLSIRYEHWPTGRGNHSHISGHFDSSDMETLRGAPWLVDRGGVFHKPCELSVSELNENYDCSNDAAEELIRFLQIQADAPAADEQENNLTPAQREDIELGRIARELGFSRDEAEAILQREKHKISTQAEHSTPPGSDAESSPADSDEEKEDDRTFRKAYERQSSARKSVLRSLMGDHPEDAKDLDDEEEGDADEYTPPSIDYQKRIKQELEKGRREVENIARKQELSDRLATGKYTYGWFCALMELEALTRKENESGSREICISFGRVEPEPRTERTLLLKQPSRYIPHWMEELASDIPLTIQAKGREHRVMIEVSSVKGYTLHTRLRNAEDVKKIDLNGATASISVQNPGFLLESLREGFSELDLPEDYDLKANLSENIKFVFGPPGTGKTTYLAREELIPLMRGTTDKRVLVLAPTNKAADVLSMRIIELMDEDTSYENWLVRFGTTYDEKIEKSAIYKDRSFYLPKLRRYVLITTIARFPYDSIGGKALCELDWDYVVIDEASMIPIANIIYPLYKSKPEQFIIAGDPLQIQPSAQVESDENIYKMVALKSFTNPRTEPHDYEVKLLTTQYRSIPSVGEVFSQFAYGGVLQHARTEDSQRRANIDDILEIAPLNIIKYPVSKYEGIYSAKRLGKTPYHIYSALLAHEFVAFLASKIGAANPEEAYSIGVVSPYRAQADLIDRLLARTELPQTISVQVGTIHGFQGDECNMIIVVLNPPPTISDSKNMFLNKINIINVSISRARDCLFVLMPDGETEHIERLRLINKVERLIRGSGAYREYNADDIEMLLFGRTGFLEDNTFSTSHQNVNVYGLPEKRYEIRAEDTAIDVQIHESLQKSGYR